MSTDRRRLAGALVLLMLLAPLTNAATSSWSGPSTVNPDESVTVSGFQVPGNATIQDGWLHVTDSQMASDTDSGFTWEATDLDSGVFYNTEFTSGETIALKDDGSRSNIDSFDSGNITVSMNDRFTYTPGWERVYSISEGTNLTSCSGGNGTYLSHGPDNDFDSSLDSGEITDVIYYCSANALSDVVTGLTVSNAGSGYSAGTLSASSGGGSGFSGNYSISSGIDSITIQAGGSSYSANNSINIICPGACGGSGATAYVGTVSSSGAITSVVVSNSGSGYTSDDTIYVIPSGGNGAQLVAVLGTTGPIHDTEIISGGSGYTSAPSISISDTSGTSGSITSVLGGYFDYELTVTSESEGSNCGYGGYMIESGLDVDEDGALDSNEISATEYICNGPRLWQATTLSGMNGTLWGDQINMSYGVIPAQSTEGLVVAATLPGEPLPAGTDTFLLTEAVSVPESSEMNSFYMTFDHWYHLDSTSSGGGDGAWVEYRIRNGPTAWGDWTWIAPDGGYPSTISSDAPSVNGAPTGTMPVFASTTHSGWVSSNISLQSISGITSATHIQMKFHVWTDPDASNERPGWFIDNIHFNNDGVDYGVWHHGCYTTTATYCNYMGNAYGALQRTIDLTGTNSTSTIEIDMEWDLYGYYNDNACVELSLNNNTWTDISSSGSSTTTNCEDRVGAIPGYGYSDASGTTYGQQSNGIRTISLDIPTSFRNQASVHMRIIVDTDQYTHYGGSYPGDEKEGLTVDAIRVVDYADTVLFQDLVETPSSMFHYGVNQGVDQWTHYIWTRGVQSVHMGFEDSTASDPATTNAAGWSKSGSTGSCGWQYGQLGSASGAGTQEPSFPYLYGTNLNGMYCNAADAYVISPTYSIPANGSTELTFDKWICTENYWDAIGLYIKVNNGGWQYFDPGIAGWYDGSVGYSGNAMYGNNAWMSGDCGNGGAFETLVAPLDSYAGDDLKFRFRIDTDTSVQYAGGYIDNFGILLANYGEGGAWLSPSIDASEMDDFNLGWIDVTASIPNDTWVRGTLVDQASGNDIPGFTNVSFPISLAGVDTATYPQIRLKVLMDTDDEESTPQLMKVHVGGKRVLAASSYNGNGWDMTTGVEVVDGVINATSIAGTITSQFTPSSRPIKSVSLGGNYSGGIMVTILDSNGGTLGQSSQGGVAFTYPQPGFGVSVSLPTNGWIDRLVITADFAEPAESPSIDVLNDGVTEWSFPFGSDYGHYGWQSLISDGLDTFTTSETMYLDGSTATTVNVRLPANSVVNNGIVSVAPDSNGFESPVSVSVAGASQSSSSSSKPFHSIMDSSQIMAINSLTGTHTDSETGRVWKEVPVSVSSNTAQTVSLTRLGFSYLIFENVSGLGSMVSSYHDSQTQDDPPPNDVSIPVTISAVAGAVSIDGDLKFDYVLTNRDFQVPNTLYPDGDSVEIVTEHHHLEDNSMISHITLKGSASDGQILMFEVENSADGLWGQGAEAVTFSQTSGSSVAPMDSSSNVAITTHNDGFDDVSVHWIFDVNWNWDDVDSIRWVAQAYDDYGETVWPAVSHSGQGGSKAVENDLQIDSFEVRDEFGRLLSNQYSSFYPFPAKEGNDLNITGSVRFQDSPSARPAMSDFQVGLNMSGSLFSLTVGDDGHFGGIVTPDPGLSQVTISPMMLSVGPTGFSVGAEDVTGVPPQITVTMDSNPPVAGPMQVNTPTGLQDAHAKVWEPTAPLSIFVTIDEGEARGESLTMRYWRGSVDDANSDGVADESEYMSQSQPLSSGMTGQQQVNFVSIDVSAQEFNSPVHLYLEGTDWAGLSYQDGYTGGGPGAENSWATVIVATDEPTSILSSGYDLDSEIGYLLAGVQHTFTMQIDEANGIDTLDNVTVMLCGDGPTQVGKMSYDPSRGTLWTASDSLVTPIGVQTQQITSAVTQLSIQFELSWYYPWDHDDPETEEYEGQSSCKPSVSIMDDLNTVAYQNNIGELSWDLDNRFVAVPSVLSDLTMPVMENDGESLYLRQGDEFTIDGSVYYAGSGVVASDIPDDLMVEAMVVYGTQEVIVTSGVELDGSFSVSMVLPARVPLNPTMAVQTDVLNMRGEGSSVTNSDVSITVDSKSPTALFDQMAYPDSSLTIIESDLVDDVTVTITMNDEIGMEDGPLQVAWYYLRGGIQVAGTEDTGELQLISEGDGSAVYQAHIDFTPLNSMKIEQGDQIAFYVTSTDRAGNEVSGLGSEPAPRIPTLRIMEFLGQYSRSIVSTGTPLMGETVKIDTFWENLGKRDGFVTVGLYELTLEEGADGMLEQRWQASVTSQSGDTEIDLPAETTSVRATFMWEATSPGQPDLYLVIDIDGDGQLTEIDFAAANTPITGISVVPPPSSDEGSDSSIMIIGVVVIVAIAMIGFFMSRGRGDDDYYYDDEDDDYYEDEKWQAEED